MVSKMLENALSIINSYFEDHYNQSELKTIGIEIKQILNIPNDFYSTYKKDYMNNSYEYVQEILANINEKEDIRKSKGVYYTPDDTVEFILLNCMKLSYKKLQPNNFSAYSHEKIPYKDFCIKKTIYDPTCGAGAFLLSALNLKFNILESKKKKITRNEVLKVVKSINGNDLNPDSIIITKIRLLLCTLNRYGVSQIKGIAQIMENNFTSFDFVSQKKESNIKFDIIVGNPPYVEDTKTESILANRYGNIYANVLENSIEYLNENGVLGFVIPLSYISTPRMKKIRKVLFSHIPEQYILSYSDRPDCLFTSVHQKLCLLFGKKSQKQYICTGNYRYWYKEERKELFKKNSIVQNKFIDELFIPKLGTNLDVSIYSKILNKKTKLRDLLSNGSTSIYLNMRAAFWIKAFLRLHSGSEYKEFKCENLDVASYCMCLLNSSLFWWYWICISDCWHITNKELEGFKVPDSIDFKKINQLAYDLEKKLEETKVFVGTKQTEYEYKHKECIAEIHAIDDYINSLYGLKDDESEYIKSFYYRYRIGGGAENGCN